MNEGGGIVELFAFLHDLRKTWATYEKMKLKKEEEDNKI